MKQLFNRKRAIAFLVCLFAVVSVSAQGIKDIRINEIQVYNTDGLVDDYGHRNGWIELYNTGYQQVDVAGAYLKVNGKEYRIPKGDKRTVIPPQGYLIFFAEGTAAKGTFHTNFRLEDTNYVEFYDQSGKGNPVDRLDYNLPDMRENVSFGWFEDHDGNEKLMNLPVTTPRATNNTLEKKPRSEVFREQDPSGGVMAIIAMGVVFTALAMLFLIFKLTGLAFVKHGAMKEKRAKKAEGKPQDAAVPEIKVKAKEGTIAGEELAAIAIAMYQYSEDLHDIENTVLTINRGAKHYSPWSSKIYGLRQLPNKK